MASVSPASAVPIVSNTDLPVPAKSLQHVANPLQSSRYNGHANRPANLWYPDSPDHFSRTAYNDPKQTDATLKAPRATQWVLNSDGSLYGSTPTGTRAFLFPPVPAEPARGDLSVHISTWNLMDPGAASLDNNLADDNTHMRASDQSGIMNKGKVPFLFAQEVSIGAVRSITGAGVSPQQSDQRSAPSMADQPHCLRLAIGEYATPDGQAQNLQLIGNSCWTWFPSHTTPWDMTTARKQEYESYWRIGYPLHAIANAKLWWTGQTIFLDPQRYEMGEGCGSTFKVYSNKAQRSWTTSFGLLGQAIMNGLIGQFDAARARFADVRNSVSALARTDGVLIVKAIDKTLGPIGPDGKPKGDMVILVGTHLESFGMAERAMQRNEFLDELDRLAKEYPNTFIMFGGDFNGCMSDEDGKGELGDFYGSIHCNPDFAEGRAVMIPRTMIRETFYGEGAIDGVGLIIPLGYELKDAAGHPLIPGRKPTEDRGANVEVLDDRTISDHALTLATFVVAPKAAVRNLDATV